MAVDTVTLRLPLSRRGPGSRGPAARQALTSDHTDGQMLQACRGEAAWRRNEYFARQPGHRRDD